MPEFSGPLRGPPLRPAPEAGRTHKAAPERDGETGRTTRMDRDSWLKAMAALGAEPRDRDRAFLRALAAAMAVHVPVQRIPAIQERVTAALRRRGPVDPYEEVLAPLIEGDRIHLFTGPWTFGDRKSLNTVVEEILFRREYQFKSGHDSPLVIDAGANFGLATYYVKRMHLAKRVICFEPSPLCVERLRGNVAANRYEDVVVHHAALGVEEGEATFHFSAENPLAGALTPRHSREGMTTARVPVRRLSDFLTEPVALLKLDIEGAEADVLEEAADRLDVVEHLFCEVHPVEGQTPSLLARVLAVLERAGFCVHVGRSPWSERAHAIRPLMHACSMYSLSVFAKRREG